MKGVILCAGRGTRMQPFSHSTPKTLLPVANQPILDHCIQKMQKVGIREIGVVINPLQTSIVDYVARYAGECTIQTIHQNTPLGIAHALKMAQGFLGDDPFVLMLGDNLILESLETLVDAFQGRDGAILLSKVDKPRDYGIAEIKGEKIVSLEEKPPHPKSDLAVIGAYVFTSAIFSAIDEIKPSARGEYEITDAIQRLIEQGRNISYSITAKPYSDVGTLERWIVANRWMLQEQVGQDVRIGIDTKLENCTIRGPVMIGDGCTLKNAVIGPHVSIQDRATVVNCEIAESILLEGASIQSVDAKIEHSVFGRNTTLHGVGEQNVNVKCMLGDHSQVKFPKRKPK